MMCPSLLKKSTVNIGIFQRYLSNDIFNDIRFTQLVEELNKKENISKYNYAIYCDTNGLKANIFIPIFNTIYLSCSNNKVVINDEKDIWLVKAFTNNDYYVLPNDTNQNFDFEQFNVKTIKHIQELGEV